MKRRDFIAAAGALALAPSVRAAVEWPTKPVRWVVGYAAGGGSDVVARTIGAQLAQQIGQQVVVDNRPGGATLIASEMVAKAAPDGYTIYSGDNGSLVYNPALFRKLPYDPVKDYAPVGLMTRFPLVLAVAPGSGHASAKDLVEWARKNPGKLSYASAGMGSPHHLAMELLKERAKFFALHVPYRGAAPAMQDVMGGQVPAMVVDTASGMPMMKAGKLKPLAVFSRSRLPALPDVPSLIELGYTDIEAFAWQGMVVPAATPKEVVARLSTELQKAIAAPAVRAKLTEIGLELIPSDPQGLSAHLAAETKVWQKLIRDRNITLD